MSIQIRSTAAKGSLILATIFVVGVGEARASLTVDDSLNRYSLYGSRGVQIDYRATTSVGGWVGSDKVVSLQNADTIRSVVTSGNQVIFGNNQNYIWNETRLKGNLSIVDGSHFQSSVYCGGTVTATNQFNWFQDSLFIAGGHFYQPPWPAVQQFGPTQTNSPAIANDVTPSTSPQLSSRLVWGTRPATNVFAIPSWPDTVISPTAGVNVKTSNLSPNSGGSPRWTCGSNRLAGGSDLVSLGICADQDTILPPGSYDQVDLWFGSTLYLGEGIYHFNFINLQNAVSGNASTRLLAVQPHGARTVILTKNGLSVKPSGSAYNVIAPEKYRLGYGTDSLHFAGGTMMIYSEASLTLNVQTEIWASVIVPKAGTFVELWDRVHLFGQILADSIAVHNDFKGTDGAFIPYFPNPPVVKVANFGWTGPEGALGQTTAAGLSLQMDHINGMGVKVWYHTVTPTKDTTIKGVVFKPAFTGDFDSSGGMVFIPATMTSGSIPVNIHGNNLHQPNRYFLVILDSIQNGSLDSTVLWNGKVAGGGYILDDDPTPTFKVDSVLSTEGTGPGTKTFKFVLTMIDSTTGAPVDPSRSGGASFTWSTIAGTADSTDFIPVHGRAVTWPVGQMRDTLKVQVWQDSSYEATETFQVRIDTYSNVQAVSPKAVRQALGTIVNDDSVAKIFVSDTFAREGDTLFFRAWLSSVSALDACFNWSTSDGTAIAGKDYVASSGTGTCIHPGATSMLLKVPTLADQIFEDTETVRLAIHPVSGITRTGSDTNGVGKIVNTTPTPTVFISDDSVKRPTSGTTLLHFRIHLVDSTTGAPVLSAGNSLVRVRTVAGTAVAGTDFAPVSDTVLRFRPLLDSVLTLDVTVYGSTQFHQNPLTVFLAVDSTFGIETTSSRYRSPGTGKILSAVGRPVLYIDDTSAQEGRLGTSNPMTFLVRLLDSTGASTTSRDTIAFNWSTADSTTTAGTDYTAVPGASSSILPGRQSTTLTVSLIGNDLHESNRILKVQLTPTTGRAKERLKAIGTILDDDPLPLVSIDDQTGYRPLVTDTTFTFHVSLNAPSGLPVTVRWRTADSTAKVGLKDYSAGNGVLTFAKLETSKIVRVNVRTDLHFAPSLSFKVVLDSLAGARFADSLGVGTILNSNPKPIVRAAGGRYKEGDTGVVSIRLIDPRDSSYTYSRAPIPYSWSAKDSTAVKDSDYVALSASPDTVKPLAFLDSLRFRMVVHQMSLPQRDFRVSIAPDASVFQAAGSVLDAVVTVWNDYPPPKVWIRSERYPEPVAGDTSKFIRFTVSLTAPSGYTNVVVVRTADSTALAGQNYLPVLDTLVFPPKTTSASFNVPLRNDGLWDTSKVFKAILVSHGATLRDSTDGTGTIVNVDPLKAGILPAIQTVGKDTLDTSYAYFHVSLSVPANQSVSVKFATQDSTVQAPNLYLPISGRIVFRPGQTDSLLRVVIPPSYLKLTQANYFKLVLDSAKVILAGKDSMLAFSSRQGMVRIFDATGTSRLAIDSVVSPKRDTIVWFRIHLSRPIASDQTLQFQVLDGTALGGRDFRDTSGSHLIHSGQILDSIPVHILPDDVYYSTPRTFTLFLSYQDTSIFLRNPNGPGKIVDQTSPSAVSISDAPAVRETQTAYFPLNLTVGNADTMRVVWHTVAGSAKPDANYVNHASDTLIIPPRSTSRLIEVATLDDGVYDTTLHFQVRIDTVLGGNGQVGSPRVGTGAIFDGGGLPGVKFATTDTTVREDLSPDSLWLSVVLTRRMGYSVTVPVLVDSVSSTARVPGNFELPGASVTFPAGRDTVRLLVLVHHDSINTDNLKAVIKLAPRPRDSLVAQPDSIARITIVNVDPPPFIAFHDSLIVVRQADTTVLLVLQLSKRSGKTISGAVAVSGGNARSGIDYDSPTGGFTFVPGTTTATVPLALHDDHRYGPARDLFVHLGALDTSKALPDPLTSRVSGDARDTVLHLLMRESSSRPTLRFDPALDTAFDAADQVDLSVAISALSDSAAGARVDFLDSAKADLRKLHLALVNDSAVVDSAKAGATVRLVWRNDGVVYDTARVVHLVLRDSRGAGIGRDSILTLVLRNSNKPPLVVITRPSDSSRTANRTQVVEWAVNGIPQPPFTDTLVEGPNGLTACFTDSAGNKACDTVHVLADFTAPAVHVFKITGPDTRDSTKDTTWWGKKARTRFGTDTVWYAVRDSAKGWDGNWRVKVDTHSVATDFHGDSLFAVPVSACDSAGNCGRDTGWIDLKQSIPVVKILTPPTGANVVAGILPVVYRVTDAGKTWQASGTVVASQPGKLTITRCYTDDVGNTGCDSHWVQIQPIHVVSSVYVDLNGDGRVDAAIVTLDSRWTGSKLPSFNFTLNDSIRIDQSPDSADPFYTGSTSRGTRMVVGKDTIWVEAGSYMTDSAGKVLLGIDGDPLTNILGDTAREPDGSILRDSLGRVLYKVAGPGKADSTRLVVPIVPPFAFGMTSVDTSQCAQMISTWTVKDSSGKVTKYKVVDTFAVGDQVAPVILSAVIHRVENYKDQDTLVVKPSEALDLSSGRNWLEVWRCGNGKASCDSTEMAWVKVPADSVHKNADGTYWFLVPPGDSGSISPSYKVRFSAGVSDALHNATDTSNIHWATVVTGVARPPLVLVVAPSRIPEIPASEASKTSPGAILLKVTKGKSDGTEKSMQWWEPGKGYVSGSDPAVQSACPKEDWCNGPTMEINRPARLILYIYDLEGIFATSRSISITQADLDAMEPDQLDRVSIRFDWNHRTNDGRLVGTGVYLWRIVSYVQIQGKPVPVMNNQIFKVGVKVK